MAIKVEHELHERRRSRNSGVGLLLLGVVAIVFGLTVVKVLNLESIAQFERFDHVARPQIDPAVMEAMSQAQQAETEALLTQIAGSNWQALPDDQKAAVLARLEALGVSSDDIQPGTGGTTE